MTLSLSSWLPFLSQFDKLWVAYSGGLDSQVLLDLLAKEPGLKSRLTAIHVNHGLSENADLWVKHCLTYCNSNNIPIVVTKVKLATKANLEQQARDARYEAIRQHLGANDCLLLGHHQDDQAETVLLQLLRGSGADGLAAMPVILTRADMQLVRPLLAYSRADLSAYAKHNALEWVTDESNLDSRFDRNYLRNELMPMLKAHWPGVTTTLSRCADNFQQTLQNLNQLAVIDAVQCISAKGLINIDALSQLPLSRQTNLIRYWLKQQGVKLPSRVKMAKLFEDVIAAKHDSSPELVFADVKIKRYGNKLYLLKGSLPDTRILRLKWDMLNSLQLPMNLGSLRVTAASKGMIIPKDVDCEIGFRRGGESIRYRGMTRSLKKLMQQWHIPPWQRDQIPLLFIDGRLACVVGYAISDDFFSNQGAVCINLV